MPRVGKARADLGLASRGSRRALPGPSHLGGAWRCGRGMAEEPSGPRFEGTRALVFAAPLFEDLELLYPLLRLREAGVEVTVAGSGDETYEGKRGHPVTTDTDVSKVTGERYDVVVIPGGFSPDKLRTDDDVLQIVRRHIQDDAIVASICHGPWVLASAGILEGRKVTSWPSVRDDLRNAGADVVDEEVVVDGNLVTSRKPDDLPAFCRAILTRLAERTEKGKTVEAASRS